MKVLYSEGVFEELVEISYYLATDDEETAQRFLDSCDSTFKLLSNNKFVGFARASKFKELDGIRFFPVNGFPRFQVAYLPLDDGVRILHVIHGARGYGNRFELD